MEEEEEDDDDDGDDDDELRIGCYKHVPYVLLLDFWKHFKERLASHQSVDPATWKQIDALIEQKMPWRDTSRTPALAHFAPKFPWRCPCCSYSVKTAEEQETNILAMKAAMRDKTEKGKKEWAARVATHCDKHEHVMEFNIQILNVHPRDNVVDLLHGNDINIPQRLCKFGHEDPKGLASKRRKGSAQ